MADEFGPRMESAARFNIPRFRIRVNVAKTATKGYTADTTVEAEWEGDWNYVPAPEEHIGTVEDVEHVLGQLLVHARCAAQTEIAERERIDAEKAAATP